MFQLLVQPGKLQILVFIQLFYSLVIAFLVSSTALNCLQSRYNAFKCSPFVNLFVNSRISFMIFIIVLININLTNAMNRSYWNIWNRFQCQSNWFLFSFSLLFCSKNQTNTTYHNKQNAKQDYQCCKGKKYSNWSLDVTFYVYSYF